MDFLRAHLDEFLQQTAVGIWGFEVQPPVPLELQEDELVDALLARAVLRHCNAAMAAHHGAEGPEALIGVTLGAIIASGDLIDRARVLQALRAEKGRSHALPSRLNGGGAPQCFLDSLIWVREGGALVRLWGTLRDVSELREAERGQLELKALLLDVDRQQSETLLAAGIAHDFNNLLTSILGNAELASLDLDAESMPARALRSIQAASLQASQLARLLVEGARRKLVERETVDLSKEVRELAATLDAIVARGVRLELELLDGPLVVAAAPARLQQVLINLVQNASDALERRAGAIAICTARVRAEPALLRGVVAGKPLAEGTECALLTISDQGCGMGADVLGRVLEPFFSTKFGGTGLGLPAVACIVDEQGGQLALESAPGRGTTVRVLLPLAREGAPPAGSRGARAEPGALAQRS